MRRKGFSVYHRDSKWYATLTSYTFGNVVVDATPCAYCGMPAEGEDHTVPLSFYQSGMDAIVMSDWRFSLVPACHECNIMAGNSVFETVAKKRRYIQERLKCRYKRILSIPFWDEDEILSLSEDFAQYVRHGLRLKEIILRRIKYHVHPANNAGNRLHKNVRGNGIVPSNVVQLTTPSVSLKGSGFCEGDGI